MKTIDVSLYHQQKPTVPSIVIELANLISMILTLIYPLVNVLTTMERSTVVNGKTHRIGHVMFNGKLLRYQRVGFIWLDMAWSYDQPVEFGSMFWEKCTMHLIHLFNSRPTCCHWKTHNRLQLMNYDTSDPDISSGWWFGTCYIFRYIGNNHPNWLIFFRGVAQPPTNHIM